MRSTAVSEIGICPRRNRGTLPFLILSLPIRSFHPNRLIVSVLTALFPILALSVPAVSAQEHGPITTTYTENDDSPVLALMSSDPEGMAIHWAITGLDADDFSISEQGVLTFRKPPDFEEPTDRQLLNDADPTLVVEEGGDNEYHLVVHAIEVRQDEESGRALSSSTDVVVVVRNVNEPNGVELNRLQPEVGTPVTAVLTDAAGTGGEVSWRWFTSKVLDPDPLYDNHWSVVTNASTSTYTPRGDRVDGAASGAEDPDAPIDEGRYLRVVASYTDGNGVTRNAIGVSARAVRAEVSSDSDFVYTGLTTNGSPGFSPHLDYSFSVPENSPVGTAVGRPVIAVDPNDDILTYELDDTRSFDDTLDSSGDVGAFSIDMATGQIKVAVEGLSQRDGANEPYRFFVRAVDPSGETAEVEVSISHAETNDPPVIGSASGGGLPASTLWVDEQAEDGTYTGEPDLTSTAGARNLFSVTDPDVRGQVSLDLEGEDRGAFALDDTDVGGRAGLTAIVFRDPPDYEEPDDWNGDNVYKVTLVATDNGLAETRWPLTVVVNNLPEEGEVTTGSEAVETSQPRVGQWVHTNLADGDGEVAPVTWQWSRAESASEGALFQTIPGATGPSYMPTEDDRGHFLRVTATYIDSTSDVDDPRTTRLDERVQKLEGSTVTAKTAGDRRAPDRLYRVTSTPVHAVKGPDTDEDDSGTPVGFAQTSYDREIAENAETGTIVGAPVRVQDHSDSTTYVLEGPYPRDYFTIDRHGQIRVGAVPRPENSADLIAAPPEAAPVATTTDPDLDYERDNSYTLAVRATGGAGDSATRVNVTLRDLNETPYFTKKAREQAEAPITLRERSYDLTVAYLTAVEPDGDGLRWDLTGPDARSFTIDNGRLELRERPDFERPGSVAGTNTYSVTAAVTELTAVGGGPLKSAGLPLTVEVTNRNDPGVVDFSLLQPEAGTPLTARLFDVDGPVSGAEWTWHLSKSSSPSLDLGAELSDLAKLWTQISGAQSETYAPVGVDADTSPPSGAKRDEGRYLLARATYTDSLGEDNVAWGVTAHPVRPDVSDAAKQFSGLQSR